MPDSQPQLPPTPPTFTPITDPDELERITGIPKSVSQHCVECERHAKYFAEVGQRIEDVCAESERMRGLLAANADEATAFTANFKRLRAENERLREAILAVHGSAATWEDWPAMEALMKLGEELRSD